MAIVHRAGFRPHVYRESPWYWPIAPALARFDAAARFPTPDELSELYEERRVARELPPLRFIAAQKARKKRPRKAPVELAELYEGRIIERREVPTRPDDWHDLFNALAFVTFPRAKQALHARQYRIMRDRLGPGATRLPNARTREQDALSLFDEGGLCVAAPPELEPLLSAFGEPALCELLAARRVRAIPFGHALYEHLVAGLPCPLATVHVVALGTAYIESAELLEHVDRALALSLADPQAFLLPNGARGSSLTRLLESMQ